MEEMGMQDVFYSKLQWIYGVIEVNSSCLSREWLESKEMVDDTCRWQLCMTMRSKAIDYYWHVFIKWSALYK